MPRSREFWTESINKFKGKANKLLKDLAQRNKLLKHPNQLHPVRKVAGKLGVINLEMLCGPPEEHRQ